MNSKNELIDPFLVNSPLSIMPFKVTVEELIPDNEKYLEQQKKDRETNQMLFNKKFKLNLEVQNISIAKLIPFEDPLIVFNEYSEDDHELLKNSIVNYGLLSPIIIWRTIANYEYIISGIERVKCYIELYNEAEEHQDSEKMALYEKIPSFVIQNDQIDEIRLRDIIIDSNLCSRKMDAISFSNAISAKIACKFADKEARKDFNIMDEVSKELMRSKPTLYRYKKLQNLSKGGAYLLQRRQITLKSAVKLAGYSEELQKHFLNSIGVHKVTNEQIKAFNVRNENNKKEVENSIKVAKEVDYPFFTLIKIKVRTKYSKMVYEKIMEQVKKIPREYLVKVLTPKLLM